MSTTTAEPEVGQQQDVDVLADLDEAWEIPCDIPRITAQTGKGWPKCNTDRADWVAYRGNCCPQSPRYYLLCNSCKDTFQRWSAHLAALACGWCGEPTDGPLTFVPLRKT